MKTKIEAFDNLAVKRMNNFLKVCRLLANLGNKANYTSTTKKVNAMLNAIDAEVSNIREALTTGKVLADGFSFTDNTDDDYIEEEEN